MIRHLRPVRELVDRAYFLLCLTLGQFLRSARYSRTLIVSEDGERRVRKYRLFYAPFLVRMGRLLVRILNTGVRVLPQRDWEEHERLIYARMRGSSIRVDKGDTLVLPFLAGETLATLLENPEVDQSARRRAIELAVVALAELHAHELTHADAMAENVMVDLDAGAAHWFDFENAHEAGRPMAWRRADDVRALLSTCLLRTRPEHLVETLRFILEVYGDDDVTGFLTASFTSVWRRPLTFHLGQAALSFQKFRDIGSLLRARRGAGVYQAMPHASRRKSEPTMRAFETG